MTNDAREPWETVEGLLDFACAYVRTGNATLAVQQARVVNPQYRVAIWAEKLLRRPDVRQYIEEEVIKRRQRDDALMPWKLRADCRGLEASPSDGGLI
jgi:hypothetical protein